MEKSRTFASSKDKKKENRFRLQHTCYLGF